MATTINGVIEYVKGWRANNAHTVTESGALTEQSAADFLRGLNAKISELSHVPDNGGSKALFYSNVVEGDYYSSQYVNDIVAQDGRYYSIQNTDLGKITYDQNFIRAVYNTVGDNMTASRILQGGTDYNLNPSKYAVDIGGQRQLSVSDYASKLFTERMTASDVTIIMPKANQYDILGRTEIPEMLNNSHIKTINGHSVESLKQLVRMSSSQSVSEANLFEFLKADSMIKLGGVSSVVDANGRTVLVDTAPYTGTSNIPSEQSLGSRIIERLYGLRNFRLENYAGHVQYNAIKSNSNVHIANIETTVKVADGIATGKNTGVPDMITNQAIVNMHKYMFWRGVTMKSLGTVGAAMLAWDLGSTIGYAKLEYDKGNIVAGNKIIYDWSWRTSMAFGSSALAMKAVAPFAFVLD